VGEAAAISIISYLFYVASSLILYNLLPLRAGAGISSVLLLATAYYLVWRTKGWPGDCVKLRGLSPVVAVYSILASLALIPLAASVMAVMTSYLEIPEEWLESAYELVRAEDLPGLLYAWVVAALLAAVGEEFVFRGVLQNSLSSKYSSWMAILIASGVFGVLHVWRFPAAFMLGAFLGTLYVVTGSLIAPIVAHITINSVVVIGSFVLERAEPESLPDWIIQDASAPAALLGVSIVVFILLMGLIWKAASATRRLKPEHYSDSGPDGAP
jgi:membrane protease YdiL (CAAX protease family)